MKTLSHTETIYYFNIPINEFKHKFNIPDDYQFEKCHESEDIIRLVMKKIDIMKGD